MTKSSSELYLVIYILDLVHIFRTVFGHIYSVFGSNLQDCIWLYIFCHILNKMSFIVPLSQQTNKTNVQTAISDSLLMLTGTA